MPEQDGFELYKRFYPWPEKWRLGDPVLVKEITGMRWPDFVQALNDSDPDDETDPVLILGMAAVAFWQGNPQMSRDKVRRLIERIPQEEFELVEGDDAGPPDLAEGGASPSMTTSESRTTPDASSAETIPSDSGASVSSPA